MVGQSPVFQILLQIEVWMSSKANSLGVLPTPSDFPIFGALIAASTSSRRTG